MIINKIKNQINNLTVDKTVNKFIEFWGKYMRFIPDYKEIDSINFVESISSLKQVHSNAGSSVIMYPCFGGTYFRNFQDIPLEKFDDMIFSHLMYVRFEVNNQGAKADLFIWKNKSFASELRNLMIKRCRNAFDQFDDLCFKLGVNQNSAVIKMTNNIDKFLDDFNNQEIKSNIMRPSFKHGFKDVVDIDSVSNEQEPYLAFSYAFADRPHQQNIYLYVREDLVSSEELERFNLDKEDFKKIQNNMQQVIGLQKMSANELLHHVLEAELQGMDINDLYFVAGEDFDIQCVGDILESKIRPPKLYFNLIEESTVAVLEYSHEVEEVLKGIFEMQFGYPFEDVLSSESCILNISESEEV